MDRFEKISFIIPFDDSGELISPKNQFPILVFPHDLTIKIRIGFVGLLPLHHYSMKLYISPIRIYLKQGQQVDVPNPLMEITSVDINTKGTILGGDINGQVTLTTEDVTIGTKGIYQIQCELLDAEAEGILLHTNFSFFSVG